MVTVNEHSDRPRVVVFFDYACQFCYLDWPRHKRLRSEYGADLVLVPFELRPSLPPEGVHLADLGVAHSPRVEEHMLRMAEEAELPFLMPEFVPNTHLAMVLGEYARDLGPEAHEAIHEAIFEAYNGRGEDIADRDLLLRIAEEHALDPADVAAAFEDGDFDDRLHEFVHLALTIGVTATPATLVCNELHIGSRPYGVLEQSMKRCIGEAPPLDPQGGDGQMGARHVHSEEEYGRSEGEPATIDR